MKVEKTVGVTAMPTVAVFMAAVLGSRAALEQRRTGRRRRREKTDSKAAMAPRREGRSFPPRPSGRSTCVSCAAAPGWSTGNWRFRNEKGKDPGPSLDGMLVSIHP